MNNKGPARTRRTRARIRTRHICTRRTCRTSPGIPTAAPIHLEHRLPIQVQIAVVLSESLRQHDHRAGSDQTMTPVRKPHPLRFTGPIHIPGSLPYANTMLSTIAAGHPRQHKEYTGQHTDRTHPGARPRKGQTQ